MSMILIEHSVTEIPERLREIDPELSVYFDTDSRLYEVWGKDKERTPYLLARFNAVDNRMLAAVKKGYWSARQTGRPYKRLLEEQRIKDEIMEKRRQADLEDLNYGVKDDLKYCGKVVGKGATF